MMTVGFLTNAGTASGIGTSYDLTKPLALTSSASTDGAENALTQGVYLDHLEVRCTPTGAVTTLTARLTWDAAGDQPATAEGTITLIQSLTTTTVYGGTVVIDAWVRPPGKTLTLYLWVKTNANTIAVAAGGVRLHWSDAFSRG